VEHNEGIGMQPIRTMFPILAPPVNLSGTQAEDLENVLTTRNRPKSFWKIDLGPTFESFTRKCLFDNVVRQPYRDILPEKVILLSEYLRSVLIRTQILANSFFVATEAPVHSVCFSQNFFFCWRKLFEDVQWRPQTQICNKRTSFGYGKN
jgi:hypothetical protein